MNMKDAFRFQNKLKDLMVEAFKIGGTSSRSRPRT